MNAVKLAAAGALGWTGTAAAQTAGGAVTDLSAVITSLAAVIALILAAAFVVRRLPLGFQGKRSDELKVVAQLPLGPRERLLLVEARGSELLIAVSPAGVFNVAGRAHGGAELEPRFRVGEPQ